MEFNLAPLCTRRDIAMLGLIHRTRQGSATFPRAVFSSLVSCWQTSGERFEDYVEATACAKISIRIGSDL